MFEGLNYEELRRRANERPSDQVVAKLAARGERRSVVAGEALYRVDDRQYPLVFAISATLEVRDPDGLVLGVMEPGGFTGELALLFGQTASPIASPSRRARYCWWRSRRSPIWCRWIRR